MDQVIAIDNLLTNGVDRDRSFDSTFLRAEREFAQYHLYDFGGFIVIGPPGGSIEKDGIWGVLVNEHFSGIQLILARKFPSVKFISANDLPDALVRAI